MPIIATPEIGIPLPFDTTPEEIEDFREKAHALFETVQELIKQGATVQITDEDKAKSHEIAATGKLPPAKEITPGTIINLEAILSEWDQEVMDVQGGGTFKITSTQSGFTEIIDKPYITGVRLYGRFKAYDPPSLLGMGTSFQVGSNYYYAVGFNYPSSNGSYTEKSGFLNALDPEFGEVDTFDVLDSNGNLVVDVNVSMGGNIYQYFRAEVSDMSLCFSYKDDNPQGAINDPSNPTGLVTDNQPLTDLVPQTCGSVDVFCHFKNWFFYIIRFLFVPDFKTSGVSAIVEDVKLKLATKAPLGYVFFWVEYDWQSIFTAVPAPEDTQFTYNIPILGTGDPPSTIPINVDLAPPEGKITDFLAWCKDLIGFFLIIPFGYGVIRLAMSTFGITRSMMGLSGDDTVEYNEWQNTHRS